MSDRNTADQYDIERTHALSAGVRYFGDGLPLVLSQTFARSGAKPELRLVEVALPSWAADIGIGSRATRSDDTAAPSVLLVDAAMILPGDGSAYARCDWPRAAFLHLEGWLERSQEQQRGPIHSYAFRLPEDWKEAYDRAWVNRIYLFLRRWVAHRTESDEDRLFGPRPTARFVLTHDVDALHKTWPLRLKATTMSAVAVLRQLASGNLRKAGQRVLSAAHFVASASNYWLFEDVCRIEAERGFRSTFMLANREPGSGARSWLMDPGYRAGASEVADLARHLRSGGWQIGMHPGFETWRDAAAMSHVRSAVEAAAGCRISLCRQHWLRFSWAETWRAQIAAGIATDFTLGFNDRPGLRNGAALVYQPWDERLGRPLAILSVPTLLMDSQFYDYAFPDDPGAAMAPWIDEVIAVGGEASLLWHVHTMHSDYGWGAGYIALLDLLVARGALVCGAPGDDART